MDELTIIIDCWKHKELKEYLMSLKGILDVDIKNEKQLNIYIKYNSDLITFNMIKMEIMLFLGILKVPSILAFDKHSKIKTSGYKIIINNICCEYCLKGVIDDLFEINGIEKVESNFNEENINQYENIIVNIKYNSELISDNDMKKIESKLNIYKASI